MLRRTTILTAALLSFGSAFSATPPTAEASGEFIRPSQSFEQPRPRVGEDVMIEQARRCFELKQRLDNPNVHPRARDRILVESGCRKQSQFDY